MGDWKKSEAQLRKTINDMNVVTGANDTNIVDGVNRLIRGYEGGTSLKLQDKVINENGTYQADSGFAGLGTVTVDVESNTNSNEISIYFPGFLKNNVLNTRKYGICEVQNIILEGEIM